MGALCACGCALGVWRYGSALGCEYVDVVWCVWCVCEMCSVTREVCSGVCECEAELTIPSSTSHNCHTLTIHLSPLNPPPT